VLVLRSLRIRKTRINNNESDYGRNPVILFGELK